MNLSMTWSDEEIYDGEFYGTRALNKLLDSDEISVIEEAFMQGYNASAENDFYTEVDSKHNNNKHNFASESYYQESSSM